MKPTFYQVHPALKDFVNHIMVIDVKLADKMRDQYSPFPPTPQNNINFYPADPMYSRKIGNDFTRLADAVIIGPQTTRVDLSMGKHHSFVSVAFHPGGMFRLLQIPMHELMDQPYDAVDILGSGMKEVNEKLRESKHLADMKNIVERFLLAKLKQATITPFERSMRTMLHQRHTISIDDAASASCLSHRQFERKSLELLGYSPKFFSKLIRFSKAYRMKVNNPQLSWGTIAHSCNYYDQMHLIKDFKEFTGTNPGSLNREIQKSPMQVQQSIRL